MARDTLTREQIVRASLELLNAEGLEGLNMRALGQRLGTAATAMYWHVGSKDELIALVGDAVWSELHLPAPEVVGWRQAARQMAVDLHAMLTRHPWLLLAFGSIPIIGAGKARHADHSLSVFEAAGFRGLQADQAAAIVFTYVLGNALGSAVQSAQTRRLEREGKDARELIRENRARAKAIAAAFPRLRARVDQHPSEYAAAPEGSFEVGLETILDGLEARLAYQRKKKNAKNGRAKSAKLPRRSLT